MKKTLFNKVLLSLASLLALSCSSDETTEAHAQPTNMGKTLVVCYSYTGNCSTIASALTSQIEADLLEIQPAEKGLKYEANGYALGTQLLNAIKAAPDDAASYPPIDPVSTSLSDYQNVIIVTPLWWSQMAAPMQTFLFSYGPQLAGKRVGLIVSSVSSGISQVEADFRRLAPDATPSGQALWINNSNRSRTSSLLEQWLATQNFQTSTAMTKIFITIGGQAQSMTLADTQAARELAARLQQGPLSLTLNSSGDFEIWGALGFSLPASNEHITAQPGDVVLYNGSNICIFFGSNSWSYTRLGHISGLTESQLRSFLKAGERNISVVLSLGSTTGLQQPQATRRSATGSIALNGMPAPQAAKGIYIQDGKKHIKTSTRK